MEPYNLHALEHVFAFHCKIELLYRSPCSSQLRKLQEMTRADAFSFGACSHCLIASPLTHTSQGIPCYVNGEEKMMNLYALQAPARNGWLLFYIHA